MLVGHKRNSKQPISVQRVETENTKHRKHKQNAKNLRNTEQRAKNTKKRIKFLKRVFFHVTMDSSFHGTIVLVWMLLIVTSSNNVIKSLVVIRFYE